MLGQLIGEIVLRTSDLPSRAFKSSVLELMDHYLTGAPVIEASAFALCRFASGGGRSALSKVYFCRLRSSASSTAVPSYPSRSVA